MGKLLFTEQFSLGSVLWEIRNTGRWDFSLNKGNKCHADPQIRTQDAKEESVSYD